MDKKIVKFREGDLIPHGASFIYAEHEEVNGGDFLFFYYEVWVEEED